MTEWKPGDPMIVHTHTVVPPYGAHHIRKDGTTRTLCDLPLTGYFRTHSPDPEGTRISCMSCFRIHTGRTS